MGGELPKARAAAETQAQLCARPQALATPSRCEVEAFPVNSLSRLARPGGSWRITEEDEMLSR